ncbi:MAG: hypothetical protein M3Z26_08185 [Bacteroidota bacterium]|nr:hypothetical protein [Bacteroidota bacterium]
MEASQQIDYYRLISLSNADITKEDWQPDLGYIQNKPIIQKVYEYYKSLFNNSIVPDRFLWAGLGRLAGSAVLGGLDNDASFDADPSDVTIGMVNIGKNIFMDLAWQHEAYLDLVITNTDVNTFLSVLDFYDQNFPAKNKYKDAWNTIISGDIINGNLALLENEQASIIQPVYDSIMGQSNNAMFQNPSPFINQVHPYHLDFLISKPTGSILNFNDRWDWIVNGKGNGDGMWQKWITIPANERIRLINIDMDKLINHDWSPVLDEFLPTGAPGDDS